MVKANEFEVSTQSRKKVFCLTPPFLLFYNAELMTYRILRTIRNSEELRETAIEQLEKVRARLRKVEMEADRFRVNGYAEIEREKLNLINSIYTSLEQFENDKNKTIHFEQQRAINQVQQSVLQQALQGALGTLNSCLNNELHLRTIGATIGMFGSMKAKNN
ncbi:ATP synthase subunit b, chloroplastic-like [Lathyrus oleraceus]|uniref:ATP synthase subunit b, chloroplastic-like n=1 Tax=Pisum sativum TaxID=3888 RepID=UPI0021CFE6B4|nr:ATP synthase subunit b, chloroplastic-like [Pisum sativum]